MLHLSPRSRFDGGTVQQTVIYNPLGENEAELGSVPPGVIRPLIPQLRSAMPRLRWQSAIAARRLS